MQAAVSVAQLRTMPATDWSAMLAEGGAEALAWLEAAARHGVSRAQAILAQRLLTGEGVAADPPQAVHWFRQAAARDDAEAINMLGRCLENGWGVAADAQLAVYWYRQAAVAGLDWGMYNLANLLMSGKGIAGDRPAALALYRQAAALGHAKSVNILGRFHEEGWDMPVDPAQAALLYCQAAIGGDFRGQFNHARLLLERGKVVQAVAWLRRIPATATPAFLANLRGWLQASGTPQVAALAALPPFQS
ncbi:tetratricopeptide repeat protein [Janthinobacterium aquaticum]|uniref:tetratricopeptide repeat protein n=1 Tax=Janthinobacterium sp. FT58W TaxID=2654254 RepID=UPI00126581BE|nr:tetratricopeptide repeat protein [Janthinobacterium sp. FT58W]KAB8044604.1 sel1 repeat family protein [Janthinobacterium sp. FT58W]